MRLSRGGCLAATGGVAQLGEHLLCKQGVVGSIPITSTSLAGQARWAMGQVGFSPKALTSGEPETRQQDNELPLVALRRHGMSLIDNREEVSCVTVAVSGEARLCGA